ncbi:hypothetical protein BEL04_18925 [Mucilaginibacter sp. PPCGB 2223]|uniref:hypothetical protein n=1 Tax=Mucilaginibacter sp. PPCGB 2223 TaxID=1886027 RepID=UPI0008253F36|nr:hypothetical protein [Mucilaginibacter sp. PPCGB 2223]OCX50804.1 hypothetical protein BEL04_18925 [Mucilaginibacter sp. PPCGB 2223]
MKKILPAIILAALCAGCGPSKNKPALTTDSLKTDDSVTRQSILAANEAYVKLSCDSLMILLLRSAPIDKQALAVRPEIDSVKNKIVYLSFTKPNKITNTPGYAVQVDFGKKEVRHTTPNPEQLTFNKPLLDYIIERHCYESDTANVNPPH